MTARTGVVAGGAPAGGRICLGGENGRETPQVGLVGAAGSIRALRPALVAAGRGGRAAVPAAARAGRSASAARTVAVQARGMAVCGGEKGERLCLTEGRTNSLATEQEQSVEWRWRRRVAKLLALVSYC